MIFDYFGTLTRSGSVPSYLASRRRVAEALGLDPDAFRAGMRATFTERATGRAGRDAGQALRWLARRLGAEPSDEQVARAAWLRLSGTAETPARDESIPVLVELRERGLRVGVVSDCSSELPVVWPDLEIARYVHAAVFSVVEGARKPHPSLYRSVCRRLGVAAEECVYVGDGGSDELAGARAAGMYAVRLAPPDHEAELVYGLDTTWNGPMITCLDQVLHVLDAVDPTHAQADPTHPAHPGHGRYRCRFPTSDRPTCTLPGVHRIRA